MGQKINIRKSSVFFSRNTNRSMKNEVDPIFNFREENENAQYLGLPNLLGRKKTTIPGYVKDRLLSRIQVWDKQLLSKGGKEILLKTVAQPLPNYAMSVFKLPFDFCNDREKLMCKFW